MKQKLTLAATLALMLTICACKTVTVPTPPLAPGAANKFDQDSYATLMGVQKSIDSLKASVAANSALSVLIPAIDQLVTDYNYAETAWQLEHNVSTAANQAAVAASLTKAQTDVTTLTKAVN